MRWRRVHMYPPGNFLLHFYTLNYWPSGPTASTQDFPGSGDVEAEAAIDEPGLQDTFAGLYIYTASIWVASDE